jgi:hypothetical protein
MVGWLIFLLLLALGGLGFLGYYALQLHTKAAVLAARLDAEQSGHENEIKGLNESGAAAKAKLQALVAKYNEDTKKWHDSSAMLKAENQRLSKWKNVADAEVKASEMLRTAHAAVEEAKKNAELLIAAAQRNATTELETAKETASKALAEARQKAKAQKDETEAILTSATTQAAIIVEAANNKAAEIAGSAYEAMKSASLYEQTVKSMKNIIAGYGDQYIVPPHSLLDDLAEDFGHTQAAHELKRARLLTKVMIGNGTAAACDYVEANRKETAINFVVDAFNGKVDSVLSRVKHDNAGKLEQEIRDAFTLVNYNGKAFRDARITEEFLGARLGELKWAAVTQQFALREREEQRFIKEQAREEARAERERERALRDAAKERETMQKAMQLARQQFDVATGEQKAMYEERIRQMEEKMKQIEEDEKRAISMAQQTKKGHVYIISNVGSFGDDIYKIGLTRRWDPRDRIDELGGASVPFGFDVHATILSDDAPKLEQELHRRFRLMQVNKVNFRKEFFRVSLKGIREAIESMGLNGVSWTMTAEAREYRETQATNDRIAKDPAAREAWLKRQQYMELTAVESSDLGPGLDEEE